MDLRRKGMRAHRRFIVLAAAVGIALPAGVLAARPAAPDPVTIQILNVSDWHGNLDPNGSSGGAWNISARWAADRVANPNTLTLAAGDDFGASPPLSSFFDEVPAVQAQRLMGVQVGTLGNHDFDRGIAHLQSMIDLAMAPSSGSSGDHPGQPYRYIAANLSNIKENLSGVEPVAYLPVGGITIAVIGIVNEEAPTLVGVGNFGTMTVTDGVAAANRYAKLARNRGADAVVVITHKGFESLSPSPAGPIVDFAEGLTPGLVDVVIGDHTNIKHSMTVGGSTLVHENLSYGNSYSKTTLVVQPGAPGSTTGRRGAVTSRSVAFVDPTAGSLSVNRTSCGAIQWCDQRIVDMLVPYRTALAQAFDDVIGTTTAPFDRGGNIERRQEMPIGDLIADGMREVYGTQLAFMNGGGIRYQLPTCTYVPANTSLKRSEWNTAHTDISTCTGYASGAPMDIVTGDVYTILPFGNNVLTRTVTGIQLWQALENGVSQFAANGTNTSGRFPQISGFRFTFDPTLTSGCTGAQTAATWHCVPSRVTHVELSDGTDIPYSDASTYTIAIIDFLNAGGDSYFMFADGQGVTRDRDANVFLTYLNLLGGVLDPSSYPLDRITKISATP